MVSLTSKERTAGRRAAVIGELYATKSAPLGFAFCPHKPGTAAHDAFVAGYKDVIFQTR